MRDALETSPEPARSPRTKGRGAPRLAARALLLALLALPLHACSSAERAGASPDATPAPAAPAAPARGGSAKAEDRGDFKVAPREAGSAESPEERKELDEELKSLEEAAAALNKAFSLPHDILIGFDGCDEPNAFYDPEKREITVCYELVSGIYDSFRGTHKDEAALDEAVSNATTFVFFHELGHALVHAYDLPITGREEDAVDQLSVLLLADGTEEGEQMVLDAALSFSRQADGELDELAFADEHSLDQQRYYNIICLLYGQDERKFASLVEDGTLPGERAEGCRDEFARVDKAWDVLLAPYTK